MLLSCKSNVFMSVKGFSLFSLLALFLLSSCSVFRKKPLTFNEQVLAEPVGSNMWFTEDNILSKGKRGVIMYSNLDLFRKNVTTGGSAYGLRFSPTTLLEMTRYPASDSTLDLAVVKPEVINAPYYFITAKGRRNIGIWQPDGYRIYLIHRFVTFTNNGGYLVELIQLQ